MTDSTSRIAPASDAKTERRCTCPDFRRSAIKAVVQECLNCGATITSPVSAATPVQPAKWIPVGERLPNTAHMVLFWSPNGRYCVEYGYYDGLGGRWMIPVGYSGGVFQPLDPWVGKGAVVTHWRELPEPPHE